MTFLPVVAREMSVLARRKSTYWSRTVTGLVALLVMLWLLVVSRAHISYADMGRSLFMVLSSICFTFTVLVGIHTTSDSVSEEKREGTLGLLFLTDLKGLDVIGGKLAASSLGAVLALFGVIPMLSLAMLLGGVTFQQFGLGALVLANTMFFSLALGVFISTVSENERKAMMGTFVGLALVVLGPFALEYFLRFRLGIHREILLISPLYAFEAVHANPAFTAVLPPFFWSSVICTQVLAWGLLFAAAVILPRCVNVLPNARFARVRNWMQEFVYGRIEERKKHRAQLLDRNAFLWLASRERVKPKYAWGVIACFGCLYLWIVLQFSSMMFDFAVVGTIMFLLHLVFKIWAASEVCSRLIQDRRSGALELLLSTPLSVKEIADGQTKALVRLFLKPIAFLLGLELLLLYFGLRSYGDLAENNDKVLLYTVAISTFLLDIWALKWVGLWLSLKGKSIERVLAGTLLRILSVPWLIFAVFMGLITSALLLQQREPDGTEVLAGWWMISLVVSLWFGISSRRKFLRQFRELAAGRFESNTEIEEAPVRKADEAKAAGPKVRIPQFYRRHPITASIFLVVAMLILFGGIRGRYWNSRAEREFDRIREQGQPVTLEDLHRYYPIVSRAQNGLAMLDDTGPIQMTTRRLFTARRNATNVTSDELRSFRLLLAANEPALKAMWRLPEYSQGSFDQLTFNNWMQQYMQSGYMAVVDADLMDTIHGEGGPDLDRVRRDVFALLAHARLLREQPLNYAQDKAQEALHRLAGALSFILERDLLDDETLARVIEETERMQRTNMLVRTLAVHRANMIYIYRNPAAFVGMGFRVPGGITFFENLNAALGFSDQGLIKAMRIYDRAQAAALEPLPDRLDKVQPEVHWPTLSTMGRAFYRENIPDLFWKDAMFTANLNLIRAGVAAKQYQHKHGALPKSVHQLVPEFLTSVPIDPFRGEPLRIILLDRLVIYSVGLDRTDNTAPGSRTNVWADLLLPVK